MRCQPYLFPLYHVLILPPKENRSIVAVIGKVKLCHFFWKSAVEKLRDLSSLGVGDANRAAALVLLS